MKKSFFLFLLMVGISLTQSCKRENVSQENFITQDDVDSVIETERLTDDFLRIIDSNALYDTQSRTYSKSFNWPTCVNKTILILSPTHYKITLQFDPNGCEMPNGSSLSGTLVIDRNFDLNKKTYSGSIYLKQLTINHIEINGRATFVMSADIGSGFPQTNYKYDFTYTFPNGDIAKIDGKRTRVWVEGFKTPAVSDDVFHVSGHVYILKRNGVKIDVVVIDPLKRLATYPYYISGVLELEKNNQKAKLDFGNGDCDNEATLIFPDGHTQTITLKP